MARWATCQLDELYVSGSLRGGRLTRGARVDLESLVSPGVTYADALGAFAAHFTPDDATAPAAPMTGLPVDDESAGRAGTDNEA